MKKHLKRTLATVMAVAIILCAAPMNSFIGYGLATDENKFSDFKVPSASEGESILQTNYCDLALYGTLHSIIIDNQPTLVDTNEFNDANGVAVYSDSEVYVVYRIRFINQFNTPNAVAQIKCYYDEVFTFVCAEDQEQGTIETTFGSKVVINNKECNSVTLNNVVFSGESAFVKFKCNVNTGVFNLFCGEIIDYTTDNNCIDYDSAPNNAITQGFSGEDDCFYLNNSQGFKVYPDGFKYMVSDNQVKILGYYGNKECVYIPSQIEGYPVTSIESLAFQSDSRNVKKIIVPGSVKTIKESAFNGNASLEEVVLCEGVEQIGSFAFWGCSNLKSISLPNSINYIEPGTDENTGKLYYVSFLSSGTNLFYELPMGSLESVYVTRGSYADTYLRNNCVQQYQGNPISTFEALELIKINDKKFYTINYNYIVNGKWITTQVRSAKAGDNIDLLLKSSKPEYIFVGWNTNQNAITALSSLTMGTADVTLYAIYKKTLTGTFIDYNGTMKTTRTVTVTIYNKATSGTLTPPTQNTYTGWTKRGWATGTAANASTVSSYTISGNTTYYGLYQRSLTLSYNANGGSSTPSSQTGTQYTNSYAISTYKNPSFTLANAISKSGSTFSGWAVNSASGTKYAAGASITVSANTTMYAVWGQNPYTLTYNANGGTGAPASQTGNGSITLSSTKPTRSGYTFKGWATSASATSAQYAAGATYNLTANTTLYAVWEAAPSGLHKSDIYAFANSSSSFRTGRYTMTDSDFNKLANYVKAYYGSNTKQANALINDLQAFRNESWGGSCYGMATTVLLDKYNRIAFNENFDPGAKTMREVDAPYQNSKVQSAINYYMISQSIGFTRTGNYYSNSSSSWSAGLQQLVNKAKNGDLMLFCYWFSGGGHAIVIKGYEQASDGGHNLIAYDNRYPDKDIIVKVDKTYKTCVVNGKENARAIEFLSDFSNFDLIDIDGPKNDMVIKTTASSHTDGLTKLNVIANGEVTITNAEGKTLTISEDGTVSGTMEIVSTHMIVRDNADGSPAPVTLSFQVRDSKSFTTESTADTMNISVQNDKIYASAETTNADAIVIGEDEGIYMIGDNIAYSANLSLNNKVADMVELEGKSKHNVNMLYDNGNVEVKGAQTGQSTLTVYNNVTDVDTYEFKSSYNDILITNDKNGNINVLASSKGNGTFDVMLVGETQTGKVKSVSVNDVTINYKKSAKLTPTVTADSGVKYSVKYTSSDPKIVSVDDSGNIKGLKKGNATITVTVTDQYGNTVKDTCKVTVKYAWWQWIIKIVLFGWILY